MKIDTDRTTLLGAVGRTPLVELRDLPGVPEHCRIYAKLESLNPTGSLKDRPVLRMMLRAVEGSLLKGRRLLDSTSGNAGIAYAAFGARLGLPVTLVIPGNASTERIDRIRSHGAEVILTDPLEGYDFAIAEARRLSDENPELYWYSNQYENDENWRAHYDGTGAEIVEQMSTEAGELPDAFVCGIGTGGSLTGVARRLRKARRNTFVLAVIPENFPGIEGLKPLGTPGDFVPGILDQGLIDERRRVSSEDAARRCRELSRDGYFVGPSSGAYVEAAVELARQGRFKNIVTILCDSGERYLSTNLWARSASMSTSTSISASAPPPAVPRPATPTAR